MGHDSVVSGHLKSTGIPWVDKLSTKPPDVGCHSVTLTNKRCYISNKLILCKQDIKGANSFK